MSKFKMIAMMLFVPAVLAAGLVLPGCDDDAGDMPAEPIVVEPIE